MYYTTNNDSSKTPLAVKLTILLAGIIAGFILLRIFITSYEISSNNMMPNLASGDTIIVCKFLKPEKGDVVLIKSPVEEDKLMVKRVVALPKESIEIKNKTFIINNKPAAFKWKTKKTDKRIFPESFSKRDQMKKTYIKENNFFLINDNLDLSYDSREFGSIKKENIIGVVFFKI